MVLAPMTRSDPMSPGRRFRCVRSRGIRRGAGGAEDIPASLGELLVAEGAVLFLVAVEVVAEELTPDLAS